MRRAALIVIVFLVSVSGLRAQNYFLQEIQNNPANDVKYGYKFRIKNYLDSLEKTNSETQVFNSDSAKRAYYQQIISNLNFSIKSNPENPENYIYKGIYKSALYEYDSAEILMDKAIELDPDFAEAYLERGVLYLTKYEIKKGISDFKSALKINPQYTDAIYNLGYVYFQQGNYKQAKKYFEQATSIYKYHYQSYIQLGYLYLIEKDFTNSVKNYDLAIEINPFEPLGYNQRGQMYLYQNEIEKAKSDFKMSLSLDPTNYSIIFNLGYIEMEFGNLEEGLDIISKGTRIRNKFTFSDKINDYPEAEINDIVVNYSRYTEGYSADIKSTIDNCLKNILQNKELYHVYYLLNELIKRDSTLILPQRLLINDLYRTGRILANIERIDALLEMDSSLIYVLLLKGNILQNMDKYLQSQKYFDKVIELAPDYSFAYAMRAWSKFRQGKVESAYNDVELSMNGVTPYLAAINVKAILLDALNNYQESLNLYSLAINYFPDQAFLYNNRALTYLEVHNKEKAIEDCNQAIEISPKYSLPYSTRGNIYFDMGEHSKALKDFDKAVELNPADKAAVNSKANALVEMGEQEKAIELYESMINKGINVKDCYLGIARVYSDMEKYDVAIEKSSKAIDQDETYLDAYIMRARNKSNLKDIEGAISDLDKVLNIDNTHMAAIFEKARIYSANDEYEKSNNEYLKLIQIDSTVTYSAFGNIGWNYYLKGDYKKCIEWSEKAIQLNNEALFAMYNIALSYLCLGDFEKSKELYKKHYDLNKKIDEPIHDGAIQDLKDLIDKGYYVENAKYILKNIFKVDEI